MGKTKTPEQKMYEKYFHLDERFHIKRVIGNKKRSREKQNLKKLVTQEQFNDVDAYLTD